MYNWGYIKNAALAKLDESDDDVLRYIDRFHYFANEAMTQICSIKPCETRKVFTVNESDVGREFAMPQDFIAFSDDVVTDANEVDLGDEVIVYGAYNTVTFLRAGTYSVPYRKRWHFFTSGDSDSVVPAPADVCEAIISYIVCQCYKSDDELKSAIYRNEFEMLLARLDDTSFARQRGLHIGGGW